MGLVVKYFTQAKTAVSTDRKKVLWKTTKRRKSPAMDVKRDMASRCPRLEYVSTLGATTVLETHIVSADAAAICGRRNHDKSNY